MGLGLSWWFSDKEYTCQCRRHGFDPRTGKIPHDEEQLSAPQLLSLCPRAQEVQLLSPRASKSSHCSEKPVHRDERVAPADSN